MSDRGELRDEPFATEILRSDLGFEGAVWNVKADRIRYGDAEITRQYLEHTGAVAILALDDEERVLLIQQYRHPIRQRDWELPAGLLDVPGEEPVDAARRELAEEADLEAAHWEPLLSVHPTPGSSSEIVHFFVATGITGLSASFEREAEEADIRVAWVPLKEVMTAIREGRMRNGLLVNGILAAAAWRHRD